MIKLLRRGNYNQGSFKREAEDRGEFLIGLSPTSADHFVVATPVGDDRGLYTTHTEQSHEFFLKLRSPIPLFDPSPMGGRDAAKPAARAASTPTEELTDERTHAATAIHGG